MRISVFFFVAILWMSFPAMAGTDAWTGPGGVGLSRLDAGLWAEITPSGTGATPTIGLNCGSIRTFRSIDADPMTYDVEECTSEGDCDAMNLTSPIPATSTGYKEDSPPGLLRINAVADPGDTVRITCNR